MDSVTAGLTTSTLGGPKFKIQQSIPSGSIKRGPYAVVRSVELNDAIEIKRRYGEGSKPLFARDDITVNQKTSDDLDTNSSHDKNFGSKSKTNRKSSSSDSSSPERYRHRENKKQSPPRRKPSGQSICNEKSNNRDKNASDSKFSNTKSDKYKRREKSKSHSPSPVKKRPVERLPYYRDEQRERDRLRRLYGSSRSRSPPPLSARKSSPITKRRVESPSRRRRSTSRERYRRYSPYRSSRRDYRSRRSRTRSPQRRERHRRLSRSSKDRDKGKKEDSTSVATAVIPATPQYIPIPVAVPTDYAAYSSFSGWPTQQTPWNPSLRPPPASHFSSFPMWPIMPPIRPPHPAPYAGMAPPLPYMPMSAQYRPHGSQRYPPPRHNTSNYSSRQKKTSN